MPTVTHLRTKLVEARSCQPRQIDHAGATTPWTIDFHATSHALPDEVDFAVVGGGFTGLAAAAWLRRLAPEKSVAVFEADAGRRGSQRAHRRDGAGGNRRGRSSGARGRAEGFGDILRTLEVDCDLTLPGVWELTRKKTRPSSPISWNDSGNLRVAEEVPGRHDRSRQNGQRAGARRGTSRAR